MTENVLVQTLQMQPGQHLLIMNAPEDYLYRLEPLPEGVDFDPNEEGRYDFVHIFAADPGDLSHYWPLAAMMLARDATLWISYPKEASQLAAGLTRETGWELVKAAGYDRVAQVSIDDTWSAFRFRLSAQSTGEDQ